MKKQLLFILIILCINTRSDGMVAQGNQFNKRYGTDSHIMNTSSYFEQGKTTKEKQPKSKQKKKKSTKEKKQSHTKPNKKEKIQKKN